MQPARGFRLTVAGAIWLESAPVKKAIEVSTSDSHSNPKAGSQTPSDLIFPLFHRLQAWGGTVVSISLLTIDMIRNPG